MAPWCQAHEHGVDLDEAAGLVGLEALGQAQRMAPPRGPAVRSRPALQGRHGLDHPAGDQMGDDAAYRSVGSREALGPDQRPDLGSTPHREVEPDPLDSSDQVGWPALLANPVGPAASRLEPHAPTIQIGARNPHGAGRLGGGQAVPAGPVEARQGVSPLGCDIGGLRRKARRHPGEAVE